jgi:hypothetical protein
MSDFILTMYLIRSGWTRDEASELVRNVSDRVALEVSAVIGQEMAKRYGISRDKLLELGRLVADKIKAWPSARRPARRPPC